MKVVCARLINFINSDYNGAMFLELYGSMTDSAFEFEVLPQSWSKRRPLDTASKHVVNYVVQDFEKMDGHRCSITVYFEDNATEQLMARVYANKTYELVEGILTEKITSWGLQGTNSSGFSFVLRLKEA